MGMGFNKTIDRRTDRRCLDFNIDGIIPHDFLGKDLHPINSAKSNSKSEVTLNVHGNHNVLIIVKLSPRYTFLQRGVSSVPFPF